MRYLPLAQSFFVLVAALALVSGAVSAAGKQGIVMQVNDDDPATWNQALNNAMNVQQELGKDNVQVEIVAYGPGLKMLRLDSVVNNRLSEARKSGILLSACGTTMRKENVTKKDLHPGASVVNAGVVQIMKRQREGWAYVKP